MSLKRLLSLSGITLSVAEHKKLSGTDTDHHPHGGGIYLIDPHGIYLIPGKTEALGGVGPAGKHRPPTCELVPTPPHQPRPPSPSTAIKTSRPRSLTRGSRARALTSIWPIVSWYSLSLVLKKDSVSWIKLPKFSSCCGHRTKGTNESGGAGCRNE